MVIQRKLFIVEISIDEECQKECTQDSHFATFYSRWDIECVTFVIKGKPTFLHFKFRYFVNR